MEVNKASEHGPVVEYTDEEWAGIVALAHCGRPSAAPVLRSQAIARTPHALDLRGGRRWTIGPEDGLLLLYLT